MSLYNFICQFGIFLSHCCNTTAVRTASWHPISLAEDATPLRQSVSKLHPLITHSLPKILFLSMALLPSLSVTPAYWWLAVTSIYQFDLLIAFLLTFLQPAVFILCCFCAPKSRNSISKCYMYLLCPHFILTVQIKAQGQTKRGPYICSTVWV